MDLSVHRRKPTRSPDHDYNQAGAYFLTVCAVERRDVLSRVEGEEVRLSRTGKLCEDILLAMPIHYSGVGVDCHILMPDHLHWIFMLTDPPLFDPDAEPRRLDLIQAVHRFKSLATKRNSEMLGSAVSQPLLQRSFYDRYIRTEEELERVRYYIKYNALKDELERLGHL